MSINKKRGSIALARSLCYQINGAADEDNDMDGGGYGSVDVAEILSAEVERLREALAQPEQEPVAWGVFEGNLHDMFFSQSEAQEMAALKGSHAEVRPLYAAAAQRPWVGLTDYEIAALDWQHATVDAECVRTIETLLKERNHD
jgi:hypothetical protein